MNDLIGPWRSILPVSGSWGLLLGGMMTWSGKGEIWEPPWWATIPDAVLWGVPQYLCWAYTNLSDAIIWAWQRSMAKVVGAPFLVYAEHSRLTSPLELPVNQVWDSKLSCSLRYLLVFLPSLERCKLLTLQSDASQFFLTSPVHISSSVGVAQLSSHVSKTMLAFDAHIRAGAGGKSQLETWAIQWTRNL